MALIHFYLNVDVKNVEEFAKYWARLEYLISIELITMAQVPMKLK